MKLRLAMIFIAACILACTSSSSDDTGSAPEDTGTVESVMASCDVDPVGVAVQYSCDSTATSGQCVDYLEGFDVSTMDVTCDALGGIATLDAPCSVPASIGRCCTVLNSQWYVTHYADVANSSLSASELQSYCESSGSVWFP